MIQNQNLYENKTSVTRFWYVFEMDSWAATSTSQ